MDVHQYQISTHQILSEISPKQRFKEYIEKIKNAELSTICPCDVVFFAGGLFYLTLLQFLSI